MKYQIKILLISILIMGIGFSQKSKETKKPIKQDQIIQIHPDIKQWKEEDKNIQNPELQNTLKELNEEYKAKRDFWKKEYKKKFGALKEEYTQKRNDLKKKFRKKKGEKPSSLNPEKKKKEVNLDKKIKPSKNIKSVKDKPNDKKIIEEKDKK